MAAMLAKNPAAVILSGGPASVTEEGSPRAAPEIFTLGVPVLGLDGRRIQMEQVVITFDRQDQKGEAAKEHRFPIAVFGKFDQCPNTEYGKEDQDRHE